jgi:hypothetical protein
MVNSESQDFLMCLVDHGGGRVARYRKESAVGRIDRLKSIALNDTWNPGCRDDGTYQAGNDEEFCEHDEC